MKTWDKGVLEDKIDKETLEFLSKEDILLDEKLVKWDIIGTIAHEIMLSKIRILTKKELKKILAKLLEYYENGLELKLELEDVHSNIEAKLIEELGKLGKKVHTARSRNEQIILDLKLYMKYEIIETSKLILELAKTLAKIAEKYENSVMPGYTHYQQAMPYTFGSFLMAHFYSLIDDIKLLLQGYNFIDKNPLGSGAGYGLPIEIDKSLTTKLLGFKNISQNSLHTINSRGKDESIVVFTLVQVMLSLNKLVEDLILFSTKEFGFVELPDEYCTGSSIMPQKKNPDVLEIVKGKVSTVLSNLFRILTIMKNLPSGYHRDLQESKHALINSIEVTKKCLKVMNNLIGKIKVNKNKMKNALSNEIFATYYALLLAKRDKPYKEAYKIVGKKIKQGNILPTCKVKSELGNYKTILEEVAEEVNNMENEFQTKVKSLIKIAKKISKTEQ